MEPILIEDFKYNEEPRSLLNLLEFFEKDVLPASRNDILVGIIYILMLESGFVPVEYKDVCEDCSFNYQRVLALAKQLPRNWKKNDLYSFHFILQPYEIYECKIACIPAADDILVNCVVKGVENGHFNTLLDPLTYFSSSTSTIGHHRFQNLSHLSRMVKSEVCYPTKQVILKTNDIVVSCLQELPPEIILVIMSYLKIKELVYFGMVDSYFQELSKTPKLWLNRLEVDFNRKFNLSTYEKLKNVYKSIFKLKRY